LPPGAPPRREAARCAQLPPAATLPAAEAAARTRSVMDEPAPPPPPPPPPPPAAPAPKPAAVVKPKTKPGRRPTWGWLPQVRSSCLARSARSARAGADAPAAAAWAQCSKRRTAAALDLRSSTSSSRRRPKPRTTGAHPPLHALCTAPPGARDFAKRRRMRRCAAHPTTNVCGGPHPFRTHHCRRCGHKLTQCSARRTRDTTSANASARAAQERGKAASTVRAHTLTLTLHRGAVAGWLSWGQTHVAAPTRKRTA
jgi:hypothetical protein